jgi:hypothetical protein
MKSILSLSAILILVFTSCQKEDVGQFDTNLKAPMSVEFDNIAGSEDLQLNTGSYSNAAGETFNVAKLKYYVSNFVVTKTDGTLYTVPQDSCYFLIDESDAGTHEPVLKVPEGEYKAISFVLGVDSLKSTKDISERLGVLDPTSVGGDMYWSWNSGYVFLKMEGTSSSSTSMGGTFMYHIGGFGGYQTPTINNLKTITLDLTARGMPQVKSGKETNIHLMVDILKLFNGSSNISIAAHPMSMFDDYSPVIANNYTAMFKHDHTEN